MRIYIYWLAGAMVLAPAGPLMAQNSGYQGDIPAAEAPGAQPPPSVPDQPVVPQVPTLERREEPGVGGQALPASGGPRNGSPDAGPPQPPPPPFVLTPVEEAQLDRVLLFWEKSSQNVKTFRARFTRWEYNPVWGPPDKAMSEDLGEVRYAAPDKAYYSVEGQRPEKLVCDGKSIFQYDFQKKQVIEHKLPPEVQGKTITNGPMPFLFGAKAEQLKRRYWMRLIPPPQDSQNEVWMEIYPRFQEDAQSFRMVSVILSVAQNDIQPSAVQIHHPDGKSRTVYKLWNIAVNKTDLRGIFEDPFHGRVPAGWQKLVEEAQAMPTARRPGANHPPELPSTRRPAPP